MMSRRANTLRERFEDELALSTEDEVDELVKEGDEAAEMNEVLSDDEFSTDDEQDADLTEEPPRNAIEDLRGRNII